jgi:hypothetical protein
MKKTSESEKIKVWGSVLFVSWHPVPFFYEGDALPGCFTRTTQKMTGEVGGSSGNEMESQLVWGRGAVEVN